MAAVQKKATGAQGQGAKPSTAVNNNNNNNKRKREEPQTQQQQIDEEEAKFHNLSKKMAHPTDARLRERSVKVIAKWFSSPAAESFTHTRMMKIWKGLFYCFWFSDKPLVQHELADRLAKLIHSFKSQDVAFDFLDSYFETIAREWGGLDAFRLDKYYALQRKMTREAFVFLDKKGWEPELIRRFNAIVGKTAFSSHETTTGIVTHHVDVFIDELEVAISKPINLETIMLLLRPFLKNLSKGKTKKPVARRLRSEIFIKLSNKMKEGSTKFGFEVVALGEKIWQLASMKGTNSKNRGLLYHIAGLLGYGKGKEEDASDDEDNDKDGEDEKHDEDDGNENKDEDDGEDAGEDEESEEEVKAPPKKVAPLPTKATPKATKAVTPEGQSSRGSAQPAKLTKPAPQKEPTPEPQTPPTQRVLKPVLKSPDQKKEKKGSVHFSPEVIAASAKKPAAPGGFSLRLLPPRRKK